MNFYLKDYKQADIEDLFSKSDYLKFFNKAFGEKIKISDLNQNIKPIVIQINDFLGIERFNHYRPANELLRQGLNAEDFDEKTLNNFEKVIKEINNLFD